MLKAEKITRRFGDLAVLKGVDLTVKTGEMVSIVGSSGAGKSTLLHILGSLDHPDSGTIELDNQSILSLSAKKLAAFRNKNIGFIFQFHHLLPEFDALENVSIPGWIAGNQKTMIKDRAIQLLTSLGLKDRIYHKPQQMSGGEQQRVAVARALINQPKIVFADEPTGNLDSKNARELHQVFVELNQNTGTSFLIVTHNLELAALSGRTLHMKDGLMVPE
ncbi:MAG: ABC transporter ATP-binding protein [Sphingobacteriia bacterium]|nr:MAG: ABC transporter ATP-binding protein [Sphingobacteriia bacterium]